MNWFVLRIACIFAVVATALAAAPSWSAQEFADAELVISEFLVLPRVGRYGRVPIHVDPVQAKLAQGSWQPPKLGDQVTSQDGKAVTWSDAKAADDGWLEHESLRGGYAFAEIDSPQRQVVLLEASGHAMVFVNGEPRAGDPYLTGRCIVPIVLRKGKNRLLFHAAAGKLRATLTKPTHDVFFDSRDNTVPTIVAGDTDPLWVGMLLVNCRDVPLKDCQITTTAAGGSMLTSKVAVVPALSVRKVSFPIAVSAPTDSNLSRSVAVQISLAQSNRRTPMTETTLELELASGDRPQTRTFRSALDNSVQKYQLLRATGQVGTKSDDDSPLAGMLVSLHDSGESGQEHMESFTPAARAHILVPNGRRTEGCDWEDWSARDVLEAVDDVSRHAPFDHRRVWLRGTGAGGHGVLRQGGIAAGCWGALIPRQPWLEYAADLQPTANTPIEEMLDRLAQSNQLSPLLSNAVRSGILLEDVGTKEKPTTPDAQALVEMLAEFHPHFEFRAISDDSPENDLSELLRFCEKHKTPDSAKMDQADCVTFNPGVNATNGWLTILGQIEQGSLSRAAIKFDAEQNLFFGLTVNVSALSIDVSHLEEDTVVEVALDSEAVGEFAVDGHALTFVRDEEGWHAIPELPRSFKRPSRYGGIRSAFENRVILVYGTQGSEVENAWAFTKARYDAETLLVRANGSVDVVPDTAFNADMDRDRNVVLYGNADTNSAWPNLMSTSPVQVRGEGVWIDRRPELGDDLACVFVRPRRGSENSVVGVISGTGMAGMRATDRLPLFVNGVSFPDLLLFSAKSLTEGNSDVRAAGYFGMRWGVEPGEIVWRDSAL